MKTKQLQWEQDGSGDWEAFGFFGCFQVVESESGEGFTASLIDSNDYDGFDSQDFASVDEAKAYCQSLLEKQVEGALSFVDWSGEKTPQDVANFLGMYITKELDGTWWGYDKKPIIPKTDNTIWANTYGGGFLKIPVIVKKTIVYNGKWQDSLAIPEKYLEELGVENGKN